MKLPLQVTLRDMPPSAALEAAIQERVARLEKFCGDIMGCRVVVEAPHRHQHQGKLYHVRIDLTVPGEEIVVKRNPGADATHEDIYVVIRDAFDAVRRQLEDYTRRRRQDVKSHPAVHTARVSKLFPAQDYGFLETPDRRQVYFHRNSLIDVDFEHLDLGTEVAYVEEQGEQGPQAARVTVGKHHIED